MTYYSSGYHYDSLSLNSASRQLLFQAGPRARWLQIDAIRFSARDENGLGAQQSERSVDIQGRARQ